MTVFFDIKADKRLFHHYIIAVCMHDNIKSEKCGQYYLKYGPIYFTHDEIENLRDAIMLSKDEVFKTKEEEALKIYECKDLVASISAFKIACSINKASMHHFSSETEIEESFFISMVENAHKIESFKQALKDSIMT
jgi:hypothetical protein